MTAPPAEDSSSRSHSKRLPKAIIAFGDLCSAQLRDTLDRQALIAFAILNIDPRTPTLAAPNIIKHRAAAIAIATMLGFVDELDSETPFSDPELAQAYNAQIRFRRLAQLG